MITQRKVAARKVIQARQVQLRQGPVSPRLVPGALPARDRRWEGESPVDRRVSGIGATPDYGAKRSRPAEALMVTSSDYVHPCPRCGSAWKVRMQPAVANGAYHDRPYWVPVAGSGSCSNSQCSISPKEVAAFRALRRERGWDPSLPEVG